DRITVIRDTVVILFNNLYSPGGMLAILAGSYTVYSLLLKDRKERELPSLWLMAVLFMSGLSFILILPHAARMPYEARQMIPFAALLVGGVTWSFVKEFNNALHGGAENPEAAEPLLKKGGRPVYLLFTAVLLLLFWYRFALNDRQPVYYIPDAETEARYNSEIQTMKRFDLMRYVQLRSEVLFAKELKSMPTAFEPVFFSLDGFQMFWDPKYVPGYPQIMPITEYYTGSRPVLCFNDADGLAYDIIYMIQKTPAPFSPVLVSDNREKIAGALDRLLQAGVLSGMPENMYDVMGRLVVDLTPYLIVGNR
ncbi:MAG: hypothetical protein HZA17_12615, partial [Nitrospirae bacterium]|nr:hypothetical protein [Nitrospirota bacterium]